MIPAVHFQFMTDNGRMAEKLFSSGKPFLASIVPDLLDKKLKTESGQDIHERIHPDSNYYPEWAIEKFRQNKDNPNITWVQEGYRHCCERCYEKFESNGGRENNGWPDPFHEHVCLDGHIQSLEAQFIAIHNGKKLMGDRLEIVPTIYCPPNHLHNNNTLKATRNNCFDYFLIRNGFDYLPRNPINLPAYRDTGLIIVPESKIGRTKSPIALTFYDQLEDQWEEFSRILESSITLSELQVEKKPVIKTHMNQGLIIKYKRLRDWKKRTKSLLL